MLNLRKHLLPAGCRVLVALSGGTDSLALLHCLKQAREALGVQLAAVHIHHGMRGEAADADVTFLQTICTDWEVPLRVDYRDVPALARERRVGLEEAGRIARYAAFGEAARAYGCDRIATAHHADDQAETLLMSLLRGTGIEGLVGIPECRPLSADPGAPLVVRPLLDVRRPTLEAYCRDHELHPRHDRTNNDLAFRRNRIRQTVMPVLTSEEPHLVERLAALSQRAREDAEALTWISRQEQERCVTVIPPCVNVECEKLAQLPPAVGRRVLRLAALQVGVAGELTHVLTDRLLQLALSEENADGPAMVNLPGGAFRARRSGALLIMEPLRRDARLLEPLPVAWPGITEAPDFGLRMELWEGAAPGSLRLPGHMAALNLGALAPPLVLRAPAVGDRLTPLGAPGSKLLSDLFGERKIPRERRGSWPLLTDQRGILWVVGIAIEERCRLTSPEQACLHAAASLWDEPALALS